MKTIIIGNILLVGVNETVVMELKDNYRKLQGKYETLTSEHNDLKVRFLT